MKSNIKDALREIGQEISRNVRNIVDQKRYLRDFIHERVNLQHQRLVSMLNRKLVTVLNEYSKRIFKYLYNLFFFTHGRLLLLIVFVDKYNDSIKKHNICLYF